METDMTLRALMFLGVAGFLAQPALAQTPPAAAPAAPAGPTTTSATPDSLLALGYEVKAVTVLSDAAIKEIFAGQTGILSQVLLSFQKGNSVAACVMSTTAWLILDNVNMTDATRCKVR